MGGEPEELLAEVVIGVLGPPHPAKEGQAWGPGQGTTFKPLKGQEEHGLPEALGPTRRLTNILICVVVSPLSQLPSASQLVLGTVCPMIAVWQESGWAVGESGALTSPFLCSGRQPLGVSGVSPGIRRDLHGGVASWMTFGGRAGVESGQRLQQDQRPGSVWRWQAGRLWAVGVLGLLCSLPRLPGSFP